MLKQHQRGKREKNIQVFDTCSLPAPSNPIHYINRYEAEVCLQSLSIQIWFILCLCWGSVGFYFCTTSTESERPSLPAKILSMLI